MERSFEHFQGIENLKLQQGQQILELIAGMDYRLGQRDMVFQNYVNTVERRLDASNRRKKRACVNYVISAQNQGRIFLHYVYDNGEQEAKIFLVNVIGEWKVYRLQCVKTEQKKEKFLISFPQSNFWVVGDLSRNTGEGLFNYFIRAGIIFNPEIKPAAIKKALLLAFAPQIENCTDTIVLPELAGWNKRQYIYAENYFFEKRQDFPDFPVFGKHFLGSGGSGGFPQDYFRLIRNINRWQDRLLFMELPVLGILSSLFAQAGVKPGFFVNLVFLDDFERGIFLRLTQVFNRDSAQVVRADASDKEIRAELLKANDEVFTVEAFSGEDGHYKKNKIENNLNKIRSKIMGDTSAYAIHRPVHAMLMVLNDSAIFGKKALNVFIEKDFAADLAAMEDLFQSQAVEGFLWKFISFAEKALDALLSTIKKIKNSSSDARVLALEIAWEILAQFCGAEGIDITFEAKLPSKFDFSSFFDGVFDMDDTLEIFVQIVRREIRHFPLLEKNRGTSEKISACFYDDDYLWIRPQVLLRMLGKNGLLPKRLPILAELKKNGILKTDGEGLTRRMQINGVRSEFYQFKKEFLNKFGATDIADLGKGGI